MDTINRLLKKQAPKRRGKISAAEISANAAAHEDLGSEVEIEKPNPVYVRWVSNRHGCRVGVPGEWLTGPAGRVFGGGRGIEIVEG
jgi:Ino eighty subunit 2